MRAIARSLETSRTLFGNNRLICIGMSTVLGRTKRFFDPNYGRFNYFCSSGSHAKEEYLSHTGIGCSLAKVLGLGRINDPLAHRSANGLPRSCTIDEVMTPGGGDTRGQIVPLRIPASCCTLRHISAHSLLWIHYIRRWWYMATWPTGESTHILFVMLVVVGCPVRGILYSTY